MAAAESGIHERKEEAKLVPLASEKEKVGSVPHDLRAHTHMVCIWMSAGGTELALI